MGSGKPKPDEKYRQMANGSLSHRRIKVFAGYWLGQADYTATEA